jgi:hypothetical protein
MKPTTSARLLSFACLMAVYSCGNPHLDKIQGDRVRLPSIKEPISLELRSPVVSSSDEADGVKILTKRDVEKKDIQLVNPNAENDLLISFKLELGDNFSLELGDCTDLLAATKSCKPKVVFSSTKPGVYQDNLIVTYRSIKNPEDSRNVKLPLIGERLADILDPALIKALGLTDEEGNPSLNFSTKESPISKVLRASNPNEVEDLTVIYSLESGEFFKLDLNNCKEELVNQSACSPSVNFLATAPGVYKDNIIATYTSKSHPELTKKTILPVIAEKLTENTKVNPLIAPSVTTVDGKGQVGFSTLDPEFKVLMKVENIDLDDDVLVTYKMESGANFKLDQSNCGEVLESSKSCEPVIFFASDVPGVFKDNFIVTYASKSNPSDQRRVIVPVVGERLAVIPEDIKLEIAPNLGANGIDFGKSLVNQALSQFITINNPTDHDVKLVSINSSSKSFEIGKNGSCKEVATANRKCTLEVIFNAEEVGLKSSELVVSYASIYGGKEKEFGVKLLGEKIKDLNDCGDKPCGEPQKPGKIEIPSLNGDGLDFGLIGTNSKVKQNIPLLNTGDLSVDIKSIKIEGEGFELSHDCQKVLIPGQCNMEISFLPKDEKKYQGVIVVISKDGQEIRVPLKGSGKDIVKCSKKTVHHISAETAYDLKKVVLPYLNSSPVSNAKMHNLYGTKVNNFVKTINRYTVKDSQVATTFILPLLTGKVESVEFSLNTSKVILDAHQDTEAVCLSSQSIKKCSGRDFDSAKFLALKNEKFWNEFAAPVNAIYEESLLAGKYRCGKYFCSDMKKTFSANKLFDLSDTDLKSILSDKVLSLIVTDDTRNMTLPTLKITTSEEIECKR